MLMRNYKIKNRIEIIHNTYFLLQILLILAMEHTILQKRILNIWHVLQMVGMLDVWHLVQAMPHLKSTNLLQMMNHEMMSNSTIEA